jgi:hypothetical protein
VPFLLAERAIKSCSLDARSEGQPAHTPNSLRPRFLLQTRKIECPSFLSRAALKDLLIAEHGKIQQGSRADQGCVSAYQHGDRLDPLVNE